MAALDDCASVEYNDIQKKRWRKRNMSTDIQQKPMKKNKREMFPDMAAAAVILLFLFWYLYMIQTSVGVGDESFYFTIPHRLVLGDRLILDEWHLSQFSSILQYIPFRIFYTLRGSTEGIILFFRYIYVICQTVTLTVLWFLLKKYRWAGLGALICFGSFIPAAIPTFNYYTIFLMSAAVVLAALCTRERLHAVSLVLLGAVFGCCVLAEPAVILMFVLYCISVPFVAWIRRIKHGQKPFCSRFLNGRYLLFFSIGFAAVITAAAVFILSRASMDELVAALPYLAGDSTHDVAAGGTIDLGQMIEYADGYGLVFLVGLLLAIPAAVIPWGKCNEIKKKALAVFGMLCLAASYCTVLISTKNSTEMMGMTLAYGLPLYCAGPLFFALGEYKNKEMCFLWITGAVSSFCVDASSNIIFGIGGNISAIASFIMLYGVIRDIVKENGAKNSGAKKTAILHKGARGILCVSLCFVLLFNVCYLVKEGTFHYVENAFATGGSRIEVKLSEGPLKGVRTTSWISRIYTKLLRDLDAIKAETDGPVFIYGLCPYQYLYLDVDYGMFSAWFTDETLERHIQYWNLYPEKRPEYVYIPFYHTYFYTRDYSIALERSKILQELADCTISEGNAGIFVRIDEWKL